MAVVDHMPALIELFTSFLRLGLTAFGGPSMVAYIRKLAVQKHWLSEEAFRDGVALCQMIPGATAMQTAAYVGFKTRGVRGAATSFIGFGLPAFVLMMVFAAVYQQTRTLPAVVSAFNGLQAVVIAIVASATVTFGRNYLKNGRHIITALTAAVLFALSVDPIGVIVIAALLGVIFNNQLFTQRTTSGQGTPQRFEKPFLLLLGAVAVSSLLLLIVQRPLFELAALMFRIDLFAFGGGFASVPLMFHEIVETRGWLDGPTFLDGIVLGQVTPGPIVITATFVGYLLYGPIGGFIATVGVFLPSFLMVIGLTPYFDRLRSSRRFNQAIGGVLCSFVGLLVTVTFRFAWNVPWDVPRVLLAGVAFIALLRKVDILWVVVVSAIVSIVVL
jgi:chromate transporter